MEIPGESPLHACIESPLHALNRSGAIREFIAMEAITRFRDGVRSMVPSYALYPASPPYNKLLPLEGVTFATAFTTRYAWSIVGGSKPIGLSLSTDGHLHGVVEHLYDMGPAPTTAAGVPNWFKMFYFKARGVDTRYDLDELGYGRVVSNWYRIQLVQGGLMDYEFTLPSDSTRWYGDEEIALAQYLGWDSANVGFIGGVGTHCTVALNPLGDDNWQLNGFMVLNYHGGFDLGAVFTSDIRNVDSPFTSWTAPLRYWLLDGFGSRVEIGDTPDGLPPLPGDGELTLTLS